MKKIGISHIAFSVGVYLVEFGGVDGGGFLRHGAALLVF